MNNHQQIESECTYLVSGKTAEWSWGTDQGRVGWNGEPEAGVGGWQWSDKRDKGVALCVCRPLKHGI